MDLEKMQGLIKEMKQIRGDNNVASMSPEEAREIYMQGVSEYRAQNYGKAFELFLKAAENGDVWGMSDVGTAYRDGEGVQQDMEKAFYWIKKAAQRGSIDDMFETGKMYYRGEGTEKDDMQAFAWCKKAAEDEKDPNSEAMNWVGGFYKTGEGVVQDLSKAYNWHKKAADRGNEDSIFELGLMYANGEGVDRDLEIAIKYFEKSLEIDEENYNAMYILGKIYDAKRDALQYDENGKIRDYDEIKEESSLYYRLIGEYFEKAANGGHEGAQKALAEFKKRGDLCFITTAVCDSCGKMDDCYELTMFRNFRDNWLIKQPGGKLLVDEYYDIAPKIVKRINSLARAKEIYRAIWNEYLKDCLLYIEQKRFSECKECYIKMVRELAQRYL